MKQETNRSGNLELISVLIMILGIFGTIISTYYGNWFGFGIFMVLFTVGNIIFIRKILYEPRKTVWMTIMLEMVPIIICIVIAIIKAII